MILCLSLRGLLLYLLLSHLITEHLLIPLCSLLSSALYFFGSFRSATMRSPNPESAERYTLYSDSPSSRYEKPKRTYHPRKLRSERSEVADDRSVYSASTAADEYKNRHAQELPTPRSARPGRSPSVIPALPVEESSEKGRWVSLVFGLFFDILTR